MQILENVSLQPFLTFHIPASARYYSSFSDTEELQEILCFSDQKIMKDPLVLGGGSNILLTKDFDGIILKNEITGISITDEDQNYIYVTAGAGENWHQLVMFCVENNYAGMENLSLIPGNVGASPMQNIGAYGVELKDVFHSLETFHLIEKTVVPFSLAECEFGYRDSVFKGRYKNTFVITRVTFRLNKKPTFNTSYGALQQELDKMGIQELSIQSISQAVMNIRSSKLPDPKVIGNAGSFFKNPQIPNSQFQDLKNKFPGMVGFPIDLDYAKLAAGWLIEQCGWKGFRKGDAGCYSKQALVLVNYGNASGAEVYELSEKIIQSVKDKFGVVLEREVNIV